MKFSPLAGLEVVILTTSSAESYDEFHQNEDISVTVMASVDPGVSLFSMAYVVLY